MNLHSLSVILLVAGCLFGTAAPVFAQVTISPSLVFVDGSSSHATLSVTNSTNQDQEIVIDFQFGYPDVDSSGGRRMVYDDPGAEAVYSLSSWVRSFPERFRIAPGDRQVVRLMFAPPEGTRPNVYWTRMVVSSHEYAPAAASPRPAEVDVQFRQVIPVAYGVGDLHTDIEVSELVVESHLSHVNLIARLHRRGDAPFFGTLTLNLLDQDGRNVARTHTTSEAYFESATYFSLPRNVVSAGRYVAVIDASAHRSDVRRAGLPSMISKTARFEVFIPPPPVASSSY